MTALAYFWPRKIELSVSTSNSGRQGFERKIARGYSGQKGYAEVSIGSAVKALNANDRSIERSFAFLITRGWLQLKERYTIAGRRWSANRYSLAFGPDDLDPDMHREPEIHE